MAVTGFIPSAARPAAKVTACCSAIPTSKKRSGNLRANAATPVPSGIAAVIATIVLSCSASSTNVFPKTDVYEAGAPGFTIFSPVAISKGPVPWNSLGRSSAGAYPFPFFVTTWISTGPSSFFAAVSIGISASILCPSTGPKYLIPRCSNMDSGITRYLTPTLTRSMASKRSAPLSSPLSQFSTLCFSRL